MEGTLDTIHITEVLHELRSAHESGVLRVSREGCEKRVYLKGGEVVFASSDAEDERLGAMLVRAGKIRPADLELACKVRDASQLRLGRTLVELGYVSETDLDAQVKDQVESILRSVIPWRSGRYRAEIGPVRLDNDLSRSDISTENILLECMRDLDDGEVIRRGIGDLDAPLTLARDVSWVGSHLHLTSEEGFVLSRVDGTSTAREIARLSPMGEDETLRCICALVVAGVLDVHSSSRPKPAERLETVKLDPPQEEKLSPEAARFRETMLAKHARAHEMTYYELLEVAPTASPQAIKAAYFKLAKKLHPDHRAGLKIGDPDGKFNDLYLAVKAAYEVLSNEAERRRYDFSLESRAPRHEGADDASAPATAPPPPTFDAVQMARLHYANGQRFFQEKRFHEAIEELQNAVRFDGGRPEYHRLLGQALAMNPKWRRRAEEHFLHVLARDRFDIETMLALGDLYESGGMETRARKMYETVLGLDPENERASKKLGVGTDHSALGRFKEILHRSKGH